VFVQILYLLFLIGLCNARLLSSINRRSTAYDLHKHCNAEECIANKKITKLEHSHRSADCDCRPDGPNMKHVKKIIDAGDIPLVQLHRSSTGNLKVEIVRCEPYTRYTAISHVVSTIRNSHRLSCHRNVALLITKSSFLMLNMRLPLTDSPTSGLIVS
jgi:hypothetical protein